MIRYIFQMGSDDPWGPSPAPPTEKDLLGDGGGYWNYIGLPNPNIYCKWEDIQVRFTVKTQPHINCLWPILFKQQFSKKT